MVSTIRAVRNPQGLALTPDGRTLYTQGDSGVVALDTGSQAVRATLPVASAVLAIDPAGTTLYAGGASSLTAIDTGSNAVVATVPLAGGVGQIGVDPNGKLLYVARSAPSAPGAQSGATGPISVIDTATRKAIASIDAIASPRPSPSTPPGPRPTSPTRRRTR
ncbi:YncE family protein [Catenulispora yoronensis]